MGDKKEFFRKGEFCGEIVKGLKGMEGRSFKEGRVCVWNWDGEWGGKGGSRNEEGKCLLLNNIINLKE